MTVSYKSGTLSTVKTADLLDCIIETWTEDERQAHARARLIEHLRDNFLVIRFYINEVIGPGFTLDTPAKGKPVKTSGFTYSIDEAVCILRWWAMQAVAYCAVHSR